MGEAPREHVPSLVETVAAVSPLDSQQDEVRATSTARRKESCGEKTASKEYQIGHLEGFRDLSLWGALHDACDNA